MPFLVGLVGFLIASIVGRAYRFRGGAWVPGWIGGIGLLILFVLFAIIAVTLGAPSWIEVAFFGIVGIVVGSFLHLARPTLIGRWWEIWR
ncbi:MAG: hypothetical protein EPO26_15940 [Chloroflexota bacterium]|nr:MAG: hypothetical protein EPO26_15940 [Chloroflexota bacterium]